MSDDDETVIVMTKGRVYHTDETCKRITDRAREWDLDEALNDGRYECGHCQADENLGSKHHARSPSGDRPRSSGSAFDSLVASCSPCCLLPRFSSA